MKAAVLVGNRDLRYMEIPRPQMGPDEVRVHVAVCGICGSDVPRVLHNGAHGYPIVLGHEFSGVVSEIGANVKNVRVGDHMVGAPLIPCGQCEDCLQGNYSLCSQYSFVGSRQQGAFADEVVIPAKNAVVISKEIPFDQAATFEPSTVALHGILLSGFEAGKTVAVLGCGIIGLYAVQWAKILGAKAVAAISRGQAGLETAKELGADAIFSTCAPDHEAQIRGSFPNGFDYVYENSGSDATMHLALWAAAKKGRVCLIGTPSGELHFSKAEWEQINRKECWVTGSWMSYSKPFPGREWEMTAKMVTEGRLKFVPGMIYKKIPMSQAADAFALFEKPGTVKGRVLLVN